MMNAEELQEELSVSALWFFGLVAGCITLLWFFTSNWPDVSGLDWLVRGVVLATHLLIWQKSVGPLHDVQLTGASPRWLGAVHAAWFGLLVFFQAGCIFCLPILDFLSSLA